MTDLQVTFSAEERQYLLGLLQTTLTSVRVEEHRTRTPLFREHVSQQEKLVQGLLTKLQQPAG
jgi:hypothetical protein